MTCHDVPLAAQAWAMLACHRQPGSQAKASWQAQGWHGNSLLGVVELAGCPELAVPRFGKEVAEGGAGAAGKGGSRSLRDGALLPGRRGMQAVLHRA